MLQKKPLFVKDNPFFIFCQRVSFDAIFNAKERTVIKVAWFKYKMLLFSELLLSVHVTKKPRKPQMRILSL